MIEKDFLNNLFSSPRKELNIKQNNLWFGLIGCIIFFAITPVIFKNRKVKTGEKALQSFRARAPLSARTPARAYLLSVLYFLKYFELACFSDSLAIDLGNKENQFFGPYKAGHSLKL